MNTRIQLQPSTEARPLLSDSPASQTEPETLYEHWRHFNYPTKHVICLAVLPTILLVPWMVSLIFGLDDILFYGLSVAQWSLMFAIIMGCYILTSLFVRISYDLFSYFGHERFGYYIRLAHRCHRLIVLFIFFLLCIVVYDKFFTTDCDAYLPQPGPEPEPEPPGFPIYYHDHRHRRFHQGRRHVSVSDEMLDENEDGEEGHLHASRNGRFVYKKHPYPEECHLQFIRKLLVCATFTCVGLILVKWIVMGISLHYQDKVYRDRIIHNRYQLYVANLLFEGCKEEGMKHGIDLSGFSSTSINSTTTSDSGATEADDDENYSIIPPLSPDNAPTFLTKLVGFLRKAPHRPSAAAPTNNPLAHVKLFHLLDFHSFKKTVRIFKSDFTLFESEHDDLLPNDAKKRAKFIFEVLRSVSDPDRDYITQQDYQKIFKVKASASEAFEIFDVNFDGKISKSELKHSFVHVYREHHNLTQSILSSAEALRALDALMSAILFCVLGLLYLIIFGIQVQSLLTLSLSLILGFNVIIGNFSRDMFDSLIFLFITHPFDIGDRVRIEGDPKVYTVKQIYVLRTEFHDNKGEEVYMPNPVLIRKNLTNLRRSSEQWESIDLSVDLSTTEEQLNEFRSTLTTFLHANPQYFYHKFDMESFGQHGNLEVFPMRLRVQCKPTHDNMRKAERHREIMSHIKSELERLGISYYPKGPDGPRTIVTLSKPHVPAPAPAPAPPAAAAPAPAGSSAAGPSTSS